MYKNEWSILSLKVIVIISMINLPKKYVKNDFMKTINCYLLVINYYHIIHLYVYNINVNTRLNVL